MRTATVKCMALGALAMGWVGCGGGEPGAPASSEGGGGAASTSSAASAASTASRASTAAGAPQASAGSTGGGAGASEVRRAFVMLAPDLPVLVSYERVDGEAMLDGDMVLDPAILVELGAADEGAPQGQSGGVGQAKQPLLAMSNFDRRWPSGRIPYVIDPALPNVGRIHEAIAHLDAMTNLRVVPRGAEADYVRFVPAAGCSSNVGRVGGEQLVKLADGCLMRETAHELLHAAGAWHEQQRADREEFITIFFENIEPGYEHNFAAKLPEQAFALTGYDVTSVMHYHSAAFAKPGTFTILQKNGQQIPPNAGLSPLDAEGMNRMYGGFSCPSACTDGKTCGPDNACVYFVDVPPGAVHADAIDRIAERAITSGCGAYHYCPKNDVTRGQMATFLARALGLAPKTGSQFSDVAGSAHEAFIYAIAEKGITQGCTATEFCPNAPITRAQMATFLARTLGLQPVEGNFYSDVAGNPHEGNINAIHQAGITTGCGGGKYCPSDPVSRAQMATFLVRAFGL